MPTSVPSVEVRYKGFEKSSSDSSALMMSLDVLGIGYMSESTDSLLSAESSSIRSTVEMTFTSAKRKCKVSGYDVIQIIARSCNAHFPPPAETRNDIFAGEHTKLIC